MTRDEFEEKGNFHKNYESRSPVGKLIPSLPTVIRVDGKAFHTFTKGLKRPTDSRLKACMVQTTKALVKYFNADLAYTQSDEISLVFRLTPESFDGRLDKLSTLSAALATAAFNAALHEHLPEKTKELPLFDSRVYQYGKIEHLIDYLVWRQTDAERNSLTMLAHAHFGKGIHKAGTQAKHDMLHSIGVNWNDGDDHFKRGVFVKKVEVLKPLSDDVLSKIPEKHRPTEPTIRREIQVLTLPPLTQVQNPEELLCL